MPREPRRAEPTERGTSYDIVVYGATGITGRQVARRLCGRAGSVPGLRWAIAGRDGEKLAALRRELPPGVGVVVAESDDRSGIEALVASTRVVLNLAGPFARSGEGLVRACAETGVDYVDITGETPHVRRLIDRYHQRAARSRARIVPFCGFDSVPSDLGVLLLVEHFRARGLGTCEVKGFFRAVGGLNPGTAATILELWRHPEEVSAMQDPLLLNPEGHREPAERLRNPDPTLPRLDPDLGRWVAPFVMGPINTRVVRRSGGLASEWGEDYGRGFRYEEYWDPGGPISLLTAAGAAWGLTMYQMISRLPGAAEMAAPFVPRAPKGGPEGETRDGYFRALFLGRGEDGSTAWAEITDASDPSNGATVKIVCECALALTLERDRLPGGEDRAGILTPATALGLPLVQRLRDVGMRVQCPARRS